MAGSMLPEAQRLTMAANGGGRAEADGAASERASRVSADDHHETLRLWLRLLTAR